MLGNLMCILAIEFLYVAGTQVPLVVTTSSSVAISNVFRKLCSVITSQTVKTDPTKSVAVSNFISNGYMWDKNVKYSYIRIYKIRGLLRK